MKVKFWGTRGSIPVPGKDTIVYGGNTTCLEMTLDSGRKVIIDAGTGIRGLGEHLHATGEKVDVHLLITHIHWDHVMGFPFFSPIFEEENRILLDGFPTCTKGLRIPFDNKMGDGFFPIKFDDLKAEIRYLDKLNRGPLTVDGVVIESVPLQHPQGGFGFRFQEGEKTLVFITDNELTDEAWANRRPEDYVRFCEGADVLIHDAQYTPQEREERKGWGHSDYAAAVGLALNAGVRRLILFHHDPSRRDNQVSSLQSHCRDLVAGANGQLEIDMAKEDSELIL
jgi:phosphoribosyl 1,2-cyclic phosphodiesterase